MSSSCGWLLPTQLNDALTVSFLRIKIKWMQKHWDVNTILYLNYFRSVLKIRYFLHCTEKVLKRYFRPICGLKGKLFILLTHEHLSSQVDMCLQTNKNWKMSTYLVALWLEVAAVKRINRLGFSLKILFCVVNYLLKWKKSSRNFSFMHSNQEMAVQCCIKYESFCFSTRKQK